MQTADYNESLPFSAQLRAALNTFLASYLSAPQLSMAGGLSAGDCRIPRCATDPARRYGENGSISRTALSHFQDSPPVLATSTDAWAQLVLPIDGAGSTRIPPEARQRLGLVAHRPNPPQAHARCDHEMWGRTR